MKVIGNIAGFESMGTLDGPGVRFVVFMQGCPIRCAYCHNPEMWDKNLEKIKIPEQDFSLKVKEDSDERIYRICIRVRNFHG